MPDELSDGWAPFKSWGDANSLAHPASPTGGGGPGSFQTAGTLGLTPLPSGIPHPASPASRFVIWNFQLPRIKTVERAGAVLRASVKAYGYAPHAIWEATGVEFWNIVHGIVPALLVFMAILALTTAVGAAAGAALGFLIGGVGAAPGAAIGAEGGFDLGIALLNYLGLAMLATYIVGRMLEAMKLDMEAAKLAWYSVEDPSTESMVIDKAGYMMAQAGGLVFRGLLQGVVAYLLAKGTAAAASRVPELVGKLKSSRLGAAFGEWIERNWRGLVENPKLKPPEPKGGGGSGDSNVVPDSGPSKPPPPPKEEPGSKQDSDPVAERQARLNELAKDPAHGGKISPKSLQEAEAGLSSEESGKIPGPIQRDPSGAAEFIDGNGQAWDVKGFNSNFPPEKGGFDLARDFGKVQDEIAGGENVIVDTSKMNPADVQSLSNAINNAGLGDNVVWYP
jgi:hypothetical protein